MSVPCDLQSRLESRAAHADALLAHVKQQVKTLRQTAVEKAVRSEEENLTSENKQLRAEVEELKKQLALEELKNGTDTVSLPAGISTSVEILPANIPDPAPTQPTNPSKTKPEKQSTQLAQQPAKQTTKQSKTDTKENNEKTLNGNKGHYNRAQLFDKLAELGIKPETIEHPPAFTVEQMMEHVKDVPWAHCKNLFLKDKKKKLWLLSAFHNAEVKLGEIGRKINAPNMRLADESILYDTLGVKQGCVNAFALINDKTNAVRFILDESVISGKYERVSFHPMDNAATTGVTPDELKKFLKAVGHEPIVINLD